MYAKDHNHRLTLSGMQAVWSLVKRKVCVTANNASENTRFLRLFSSRVNAAQVGSSNDLRSEHCCSRSSPVF